MTLNRDCGDFGDDLVRVFIHKGCEDVRDPYEQRELYLEVLTVNAT